MTSSTTKVFAGVAIAALAATGVAAVVKHRRGERLDPQQRAHLDELDARLGAADAAGGSTPPGGISGVLDRLQRNQGISVARLRSWLTAMRHGNLGPEQAAAAESDFDALERQADQGGV